MPVFAHVRYRVTDSEAYGRYRALAGPSVLASGGKVVLTGAGRPPLEGEEVLEKLTLIEFPSVEAAEAWYHSEPYQAAKAARKNGGEMRIEIITT